MQLSHRAFRLCSNFMRDSFAAARERQRDARVLCAKYFMYILLRFCVQCLARACAPFSAIKCILGGCWVVSCRCTINRDKRWLPFRLGREFISVVEKCSVLGMFAAKALMFDRN